MREQALRENFVCRRGGYPFGGNGIRACPHPAVRAKGGDYLCARGCRGCRFNEDAVFGGQRCTCHSR